jgi:hypothetical protein
MAKKCLFRFVGSFLQTSIALPALPQARDDPPLYFSVIHFSVIAFFAKIQL